MDIKKEIEKYKNNEVIKKLNLTDSEFRRHLFVIKQMVEENNNNGYSLELVRINGKLEVKTNIKESVARHLRVMNNYLIRTFPNEDLQITLSRDYFSKVDPSKAKILNWYKQYLESDGKSHGIYVYGQMGIGKTFTTIAFANELANKNHTIAFIFVPEMVLKLKEGFKTNSDVDNFSFINKMRDADYLFLDDLGAEETSLWFYNEYLLIILNHRMQHNKPTFFNSNLSIDEFEKKLIILMHKSLNAHRLIERIRTLTKNESYEIKGTNKRY